MKSNRLLSLDVLRGLTIFLMIIVNNPGNWGNIYSPLRHAKWDGCTPTDLVFPFFLFIVGAAMWFSFKKFDHQLKSSLVKKIVKRSIIIFSIGLLLNITGQIASGNFDLATLRISGVFQRIALSYLFGSLFCLSFKSIKKLVIGSFGLLLIYWGLTYWLGGEYPYSIESNFSRWLDLSVLGSKHLWIKTGVAYDPESLFGTLSSIVTISMGYVAGSIIGSKEKVISRLTIFGLSSVLIGYLWSFVYPINKALWSSSYVLFTAGLAILILGLLYYIIDLKNYQSWTTPFRAFGLNPLFIYVSSAFAAIAIGTIEIEFENKSITLKGFINELIFNPLFGGDKLSSFMFALSFVSIFWLIAHMLMKRKIVISI